MSVFAFTQPLFALLLVGGVGVLVFVTTRRRPDNTLPAAVASARRHGLLIWVLAIATASTSAVLMVLQRVAPDLFDRAVMLASSVAALTALAVLAFGELTWPRPAGAVRTARLTVRTPLASAPPLLTRLLVTVDGVGAAVITAGALLANNSGRAITYTTGHTSHGASPFPGLVYGLPAAIALGVVLVATYGVLILVANRPAVVAADPQTDERLRRASAFRAVKVALCASLVLVGGLMFVGGVSGLNVEPPGAWPIVAWVGIVSGVVAVVGAVVTIMLPAPQIPPVSQPAPAASLAA